MQSLHSLLQWFASPTGRLLAAFVIFALLWLAKNVPVVKAWLAVDSRKVLANIILSLGPAVTVLLDQTMTANEAWKAALEIVLMASGIQGVVTGLAGDAMSKWMRLILKGKPTEAVKPTDQP